jgi:hypothetical protein
MMQDEIKRVLQAATIGIDRPPSAEVIQALLQQEQAVRKGRVQFPELALIGDWRLHFVTLGKVRLGSKRLRGFFLPAFVPAQISFQPSESPSDSPLQVTNQVTIGLIQLKFTGPARFEGKKNLLGFDFTQLMVKVAGQQVYTGAVPSARANQNFMDISIGRLPFFAFFAVTPTFIAARGRGGGLAIWVRKESQSPPTPNSGGA